jgi:hypothetical protein
MRIHRIKLENYRGVASAEVAFAIDGVTIVEGPNEVGKTSLVEALDLILKHPDNSSTAAVRAVRPIHIDASPSVELELTTGTYHVVYQKRWGRSPASSSTHLRILAPTARDLTGRDAHDRVRTIMDETLDEVLFGALRYQQGVDIAQALVGESRSLAAALDVEASGQAVGGPDEASLWETVGRERERYFTPSGRPLANRTQLASQVAGWRTDVQRLSGELSDLEDKAERVAELVDQVRALEHQGSTQDETLAVESGAWTAIQAAKVTVAQLEGSSKIAESQSTEARRKVDERRGLVLSVESARAAVVTAGLDADRDRPALDAANTAVAAATKERDNARAARAEAEQCARRARDDADYLRRVLNVDIMRERCGRVAAAQEALRGANEFLDACLVNEETLAAIEEAAVTMTSARARLSAAAASLRIESLGQLNLEHAGQRRTLREGEVFETPVGGDTSVMLEHVAHITVSGAASERQLREELEKAERGLRELLVAVGIHEPGGAADARRIDQDRREATIKATTARNAIAADLRDLTLDELTARLARTESQINAYGTERPDEPPLPATREDAEAIEQQASAELKKATEREVTLGKTLEKAIAALGVVQGEATDRATRVAVAEAALASAEKELRLAREGASDEHLEREESRLKAVAASANREHQEAAEALAAFDPGSVEARLENARELVGRLSRERQEAELALAALKTEFAVRGESGLRDRLDAAQSSLVQAERDHERIERLAAAVELLYERLAANRERAQRSYVAPYRSEIERLGRIVYGSDFAVEVDHRSLEIVSRTLDGRTVPFASLSSGAREQLCILGRLACAAIVSPTAEHAGVPVIIDDALGYSDAGRLARLGAAFSAATRNCQVIILTCAPERYRGIGSAVVRKMERETRPTLEAVP